MKIVHRNLDDAFPLFVPGMSAKIGADAGGVLGTNGTKLDAEYTSRIQGLLFALSERNESLVISFRAVFARYQTDPCANQATFDRQVERIVEGVQRLAELQVKVRGLALLAQSPTADQHELAATFKGLVAQLGGPLVVEVASAEIE